MKDLGPSRVMLGIEIKRNRNERQLFISQSECTKEILERFGMSDSKSVATPIDKSYNESANIERSSAGDIPYRQEIGSLMFIMIATRPDIAYAIGKLSQHAQNPSKLHWISVKRVLSYINSLRDFGILYNGSKAPSPQGFSDADWCGCKHSRKSTSGFLFLAEGGAVSWRSKKQTCLATSTCEAEYIAMCMDAKEAIWLARLMADLQNSEVPSAIPLGADNNGAIKSPKNESINQRNKHIDLQYHFVREATQSKKILPHLVASICQLADSLTKPLDVKLFSQLRKSKGICSPPTELH